MTATPGGRPAGEPDWSGLAGTVVGLLADLAAAGPEPGHDPAFCRVCPLCRLMARLRAVRPDLADQLTGAAEGVEAALRALVAPAVPTEVAVPPMPVVAHDDGPDPRDPRDAAGPDGQDGSGDPDPPPAWPSTVRPPIERIEVTG